MGARYFITGVQLGMLIAFQQKSDIDKILKEIEENQFIGRIEESDINKFEFELIKKNGKRKKRNK